MLLEFKASWKIASVCWTVSPGPSVYAASPPLVVKTEINIIGSPEAMATKQLGVPALLRRTGSLGESCR